MCQDLPWQHFPSVHTMSNILVVYFSLRLNYVEWWLVSWDGPLTYEGSSFTRIAVLFDVLHSRTVEEMPFTVFILSSCGRVTLSVVVRRNNHLFVLRRSRDEFHCHISFGNNSDPLKRRDVVFHAHWLDSNSWCVRFAKTKEQVDRGSVFECSLATCFLWHSSGYIIRTYVGVMTLKNCFVHIQIWPKPI